MLLRVCVGLVCFCYAGCGLVFFFYLCCSTQSCDFVFLSQRCFCRVLWLCFSIKLFLQSLVTLLFCTKVVFAALFFQSCFCRVYFILLSLQVCQVLWFCFCRVVFAKLVDPRFQVFLAFLYRFGFVSFHRYGFICTVQFVHKSVIWLMIIPVVLYEQSSHNNIKKNLAISTNFLFLSHCLQG